MKEFLPIIQYNEVIWEIENDQSIAFTVARLDALHPFVSGNKFFKLKYNLEAAITQKRQGILTMGGAYSNHLAATAWACAANGLSSIGLIRGEIIQPLNATLQFCVEQGMQLIPVDRADYQHKSYRIQQLIETFNAYFFVPEGGANAEGMKGCSEILSYIDEAATYSHILCCMGTGTTFQGICMSASAEQTVIGIPVLKIKKEERDAFIRQHSTINSKATQKIFFDYAGNGYAKTSEQQLNFMNSFYTKTGIPTDIVYTGKLIQALVDLTEKRYLSNEQRILVLHTGGLQGNSSVERGRLLY
jgi:1-aminocyclopropane-1-carboxylate deaminase